MRNRRGRPPSRVKLHAVDIEDLKVVSAALSSATVKRADMALDGRARRFAFVCNRFRWEGGEFPDGAGGSRIRCGVQINDVETVRARGMQSLMGDEVLELLAISAEPAGTPPAVTLRVTFAGGMELEIAAGCVDVLVDDMGRAWYTPNRPRHEEEDGGGA
jgi:hypothetical protein